MAITRLGHIKENKKGNPNQGIRNVVNYIFNPKKTENFKYIAGHNVVISSGINCTEIVYEQMMSTKESFGKTLGRQAYHYKLSFAEKDNVTPELAMKITKEFCEKYLGSYETVYSVHTNTKCMHSHIVFNSVAFDTGRKYYYKNGDWKKHIQPIVNDLCIKNNLSYIDLETEPERKWRSYTEWKKANEGKKSKSVYYSWSKIRSDMDCCIAKAESYSEFVDLMMNIGYRIDTGKYKYGKYEYIKIIAPGRERAVRSYVLTPDKCTYTKENIVRMIEGTYRPIDRQEVLKRMYADWNVFLQTRKIDIVKNKNKSNLQFAQKEEAVQMVLKYNFRSEKDVYDYISYLEQADKELNIIKKYADSHIKRYAEYSIQMDELVALVPYIKEYRINGLYETEYNRALSLYSELVEKGVSPVALYKNMKSSEKLLTSIEKYKKKLYVDKIVAKRILTNKSVDYINAIKEKDKNIGSTKV